MCTGFEYWHVPKKSNFTGSFQKRKKKNLEDNEQVWYSLKTSSKAFGCIFRRLNGVLETSGTHEKKEKKGKF